MTARPAQQPDLETDLTQIVRGSLRQAAPLGAVGWLKAGGAADWLFKPADVADLQQLLKALPPEISVQAFGALSNTIVRDGGVRGMTVRPGRAFAAIEILPDHQVRAGAFTLDANVAQEAAKAGIDGLSFFSGIPGTIGGALRMNAGCYGTETKDVLLYAEAVDRQGSLHRLTPADMGMAYRHTETPADYIFVSAVFQGQEGDPDTIRAHMKEIKERREASQPIREKTGGSTFANPSAAELAAEGLPEETKVWQLIDRAGGRGLMVGGAQMSEKHCNFMINTGTATAADLEGLGEEIRKRVYENSGIRLRWEVKRVGEALSS